MSATTDHQLQKEEPPVEEHPTESEKPHSEEEDDSDHFEADSNSNEDEDDNEDDNEDEDEDEEHPEDRTIEKMHYEDDSDIDTVEPDLKIYKQQVKDSEGYDVNVFLTKVSMFGAFVPVEKDDEDTLHFDQTNECVEHAIKRYNEQKDVAHLEFVKLLHATYRITGGTTYYITFEARDPSGEQKVYQAKVYSNQIGGRPSEMVVYQFREKHGKEYNLLPAEEELKIPTF